jgi:hypothetical protein
MSFFNKKEDVLEVELTQFGKQLLSKGDFEPYYYAFYDDDIIYDNQYAGLTNETGSNQNKIEERIKDVPRTRTQHVYTGIETEIQKNNMLIRSGEILEDGKAIFVGKQDPNQKRFEVKNDRNFSSYNSLANSSLSSENIPAWELTMYKGEIQSGSALLTSSVDAVPKRIPQIDINVDYIISAQTVEETEAGRKQKENIKSDNVEAASRAEQLQNIRNDFTIDILEFPNGTSLKVAQKQIILKLEEHNVDFTNNNFEIEVFELTSSVDQDTKKLKNVMLPMYFPKKLTNQKTYAGSSTTPTIVPPPGDTSFVQYFFDLNVDFEIPEQDICPVIQDERKVGNIYDDAYECPDLEVLRRAVNTGDRNLEDTYKSGVEDIEEC